jgi:hypothetical protein
MFVRIVRSRLGPRFEVDPQLTTSLAAAVKGLPGNQSFTGAIDRANSRAITISTWDTEQHANYSPAVLGEVQTRILAQGIQVDPPEVYEVLPS